MQLQPFLTAPHVHGDVPLQVRSQFNCSSLAGAPLEDQGGLGIANTHWEYELFQV